MIIEKQHNYTVIQTYMADNELKANEYTVYDINQNAIGYIVEDISNNTFEIYHDASDDYQDYDQIDYTDNYDDALYIILSEIESV